jgi:hypothetical protein
MPRTMFARCARARTLTRLAAVKLLLLLLFVVCCSVTLGADANITDVTQKRLCCNVLGEASAGLWNLWVFEDFQLVVCDQLLYEQVFEFNAFCFL